MSVEQKSDKVAVILCGGELNLSDLPITSNRSNAMIPVNGKPVIGWILDDLLARKTKDVVLVLRFDNQKLFNYVEWAFADRFSIHYAFVQAGGTILHSLLAGLAWVDPGKGVHIVLGDTLLRDAYPDKDDFIFSGEYQNPADWCLVKRDPNGFAVEYFEKVAIAKPELQAVAGLYSLSDSALLRSLLMQSIRNGLKEISHVLRSYGNERKIEVVPAKEWYDFGHIHYFNLAKRKLLQSRYFNTLEIDPIRGTITKRSQKKEKLADELNWYNSLPEHLQTLTPRLVNSHEEGTIIQEYYGYPNLAELYVFGDLGLSVWTAALTKLMDIHALFKLEVAAVSSDDVHSMYWQKTEERILELGKDSHWASLLSSEELSINGKRYRNFCSINREVLESTSALGAKIHGSIIHGDYCFSNILFDLNTQVVRLIDPRGSFGKHKLYGDARYDIAKLRHSVIGRYDFILADLYKLDVKGNSFQFAVYKPEDFELICDYFDNLVEKNGYDRKEIALIEALLFVSMVPLHKDNLSRQTAFYLTGIIKLNEFLFS